MMNPDLRFHLRALTRFIYYVTEEEDVFLVELAEALKRYKEQTYIFNAALGLVPLQRLIADWSSRSHQVNRECSDIHQALIKIYQDDPRDGQSFYVITDPERYLPDPQVQRRILNIAHQLHADERTIKNVIFVGNRLVVPQKLQRYIEVVHDCGMTEKDIEALLAKVCSKLEIEPPRNVTKAFKGLTSFEADAAIAQSIISTKHDKINPTRIDAKIVGDFKRRQLHKTDLISFVDVEQFTFDDVGGNDQFKTWARKTKASWTDAGQEYGLVPPKGVLAVGVWGCIAEGTRIDYRRGARASARGRSLPIEELFEKFNGIKGFARPAPPWNPELSTYLQSWDAGTGCIVFNEIQGIVDSGIRECIRVTTDTGFIELTEDHPVLVQDGTFCLAGELQPDDVLIVRGSMRVTRSKTRKTHNTKKRVTVEGLKYHPVAWKKITVDSTTGARYVYKRTTRARLVFEARMNNLQYEEYLEILRDKPDIAESLTYIPVEYDIHHIDEDVTNDVFENLMLLAHDRHAQIHWECASTNHQREFTQESKVLSVRLVGLKRTFDIEMREPHTNFAVSKGMIVHNCGKSLSIKAMGHAWRMPVIQLEMGRLRSSAVGESEANVYRAISLIESVAPCLIWIDEAEKSLSGGQSSAMSDAGTTSRTIGILSNWLQETKAQVCLAMTANSLKNLPIEFINRMDERFFFDLPSEDERIAILKIHLLKRNQDPKRFQLANLAEQAVNMVGREIEQAIGAALIDSFEEGHDALDQNILARQLKSKPRIFKTMVDELREVLDWVGYDPEVGDGIRARFASAKRSETFTKFRGSGE